MKKSLVTNQAGKVKEKGGCIMGISKILKAVKLLEEAFKIVTILKVSNNRDPLERVMLDNLEDTLTEINGVIKAELKEAYPDKSKIWDSIERSFIKLANLVYKIMINITLHCNLFLLRQKLIIDSL